jgi:hypothetical protein
MRNVARTLFCLQFVALDGVEHRVRAPLETGTYWLASAALCFVLTHVRRWWLVTLVLALVWLVQLAALRFYNAPLDAQAVASARQAAGDVWPMLRRGAPALGLAFLILLALLGPTLRAVRVRARPSRALLGLCFLAGLLPFAMGLSHATPEYRLLGAWRGLFAARTTLAQGVDVPRTRPIASRRSLGTVPDVLVILGESLRADAYCETAGPCARAPQVSSRLVNRVHLTNMYAVASYTAISVNAIMTGQTQLGARADITAPPTLFEWLRGVRIGDDSLHLSYHSAQLASVFERDIGPRVTEQWVTLEDLVGHKVEDEDDVVDARVDRLVVDRFLRDLPAQRSPSVAMLHLAGTHAPYFVDDTLAPHQPYDRRPAWSGLDKLHNAYRNAILAQDVELARAVDAFVQSKTQLARPWVILFTSDHGEAFGERRAIHHGQNVYPEQIRVPAFVAWGGEGLRASEVERLHARGPRRATHLDLLPTVLDLVGVWNTPALRGARFDGDSWLKDASVSTATVLPLSNCTASFTCPLSNWGVLGPERLLVAQPWDAQFQCVRIPSGDALELREDAACGALREASRAFFPQLPSGAKNE